MVLLVFVLLVVAIGGITMQYDQPGLVGARLTKWSSAAGLTLKQSGLLDTEGIKVAHIRSAVTGNIQNSVAEEFVLNIGDILYIEPTVSVDLLKFCGDHGIEILTVCESNASTATAPVVSSSSSRPAALPTGSIKDSLQATDPELSIRIIRKMIGKSNLCWMCCFSYPFFHNYIP